MTDDLLAFRVLGRPAPKGSRIQMRRKDGTPFTRAASKYEAPWVRAVRDACLSQMRHRTMAQPPYAVDLSFEIAPSKVANGRKRNYTYPVQSDLDKLARAVLDGLVQGGAIKDDRYVIRLSASKRFAESEDAQGVWVSVAAVDPVTPGPVALSTP